MLDIRAGSRVGPYKIVAPLEEAVRGGTSTLFLAQLAQVDGSQLVIVKLVPAREGGEGGEVFRSAERVVLQKTGGSEEGEAAEHGADRDVAREGDGEDPDAERDGEAGANRNTGTHIGEHAHSRADRDS